MWKLERNIGLYEIVGVRILKSVVYVFGWLYSQRLTRPVLDFVLHPLTGQYWGELGYFRIVMGKNALGIETEVAWATPGTFSVENYPCNEDASNCNGDSMKEYAYVDPSVHYLDQTKTTMATQRKNIRG